MSYSLRFAILSISMLSSTAHGFEWRHGVNDFANPHLSSPSTTTPAFGLEFDHIFQTNQHILEPLKINRCQNILFVIDVSPRESYWLEDEKFPITTGGVCHILNHHLCYPSQDRLDFLPPIERKITASLLKIEYHDRITGCIAHNFKYQCNPEDIIIVKVNQEPHYISAQEVIRILFEQYASKPNSILYLSQQGTIDEKYLDFLKQHNIKVFQLPNSDQTLPNYYTYLQAFNIELVT